MQQSIMAPRDRARFTARAAVLRADWEAARAAAATVVAARPMDYDMRLMLGRALVKLGRRDEAVPHLKAFIEKSPDEIEWPEARELLKAAETP
jgi:predicted Zn-dependent protease